MPERNFKDYKRIVEGLAYKFSLSIKDIDTEDLIQEGWVCYLKLVKEEKEKPLNCEFEAALYIFIKQNWLNKYHTQKAAKRDAELIEIKELMETMSKDKKMARNLTSFLSFNPYHTLEIFLDLPKELQQVVELICIPPEELTALLKTGETFKNCLSKYLRKMGWKKKKVEWLWSEYREKVVV